MANLETALGPLRLKNPVIAASSEYTMTEAGIRACIDAGAGAVVAKSVNERPEAARQLDIAQYVLLRDGRAPLPWSDGTITDSLFNRSGLAQVPLDQWVEMLAACRDYAHDHDARLIGSVTVSAAEPAARITAAMAAAVDAVEVNLSAPHGREAAAGAVRQVTEAEAVGEFARTVRAATDLPLIVKLTAQTSDVVPLADHAVRGGADAVAMIGRLQGFLPDLETRTPILGSWGAIGGAWALPLSLYWVSKCHLALPPGTPIVGTNGARDGDDVIRFLLSGASAVELASAVLIRGPTVLTHTVEGVASYVERHRLPGTAALIGAAARASRTYAELSELSQNCDPPGAGVDFPWRVPDSSP